MHLKSENLCTVLLKRRKFFSMHVSNISEWFLMASHWNLAVVHVTLKELLCLMYKLPNSSGTMIAGLKAKVKGIGNLLSLADTGMKQSEAPLTEYLLNVYHILFIIRRKNTWV